MDLSDVALAASGLLFWSGQLGQVGAALLSRRWWPIGLCALAAILAGVARGAIEHPDAFGNLAGAAGFMFGWTVNVVGLALVATGLWRFVGAGRRRKAPPAEVFD